MPIKANPLPEGFVRQLDGVLERSGKMRECLAAWATEADAGRAARKRLLESWSLAKRATLAGVLVLASLQYYTLHVYAEIMSLPRLTLITPASHAPLLFGNQRMKHAHAVQARGQWSG